MMYGSKEYRLAQALVVFSRAWEELAAASKACPDMDVHALYPFYILDYEEIAPAVKAWALMHASNIMRNVPDKVCNPDCYGCPYLGKGLDQDTGLCIGYEDKKCGRHPYIMFTPEAVMPFLKEHGVDTTGMSPEAIQLTYMRKVVQK